MFSYSKIFFAYSSIFSSLIFSPEYIRSSSKRNPFIANAIGVPVVFVLFPIKLIERGVLLSDTNHNWYNPESNRTLLGYVTPDDIDNSNIKKEDLITINSKYLFFLLKIVLIRRSHFEKINEPLDFDNYTRNVGADITNYLYTKKSTDRIHLDIIDAFNPYFDKEEDHIKYIKLKISIR